MDLEYIYIEDIKIGLYKKGPVGIGISGGADSAVLLYILMSNIESPIHIYNMMAQFRRPVLEKHFDSVVETCSRLTGNTNYVVHKHYVEPDESAEFYIKMLTAALDKKEIDMVYLGLTKFPPKEIWSLWPGQQQTGIMILD
jgi:NH3-dependent NAD+ synthetase